ncbi:peptidase domain-containing ABC transporter [Aquimarina agarilytica]|uniref:peptidase domain-containing ABC transporter n=1 Tax=Aquimarina agarilytica TaxID=1087449 RepID=UPI000289934E|nr:peptidase domain-containing ABC transporter [Aquimarina agarilytica]
MLKPTKNLFKKNKFSEEIRILKKNEKKIIRKFYGNLFFNSKKIIVSVFFTSIILQLLGLALPFFTQGIIDQVLVNENFKLLYAILVGMLLVFITQIVLSYHRNILLVKFKVIFERSFFNALFYHFIKLKQSYFDRHKREDFINRFQENMKIRNILNPNILESLIDVSFSIIYLSILFSYNIYLGFITFIYVIFYTIITVSFFPKLKNLEDQIFSENVKTMGEFLDTLLGIESVRLLGIEHIKYRSWKNQYTKNLNKVLETENKHIKLSTIISGFFFISQASIYWLGAYYTFDDKLSLGQYIAFVTIFTILINSLKNASSLSFLFTELSVSFQKINDILLQEIEDLTDAIKPMPAEPSIFINDMFFRYKSNEEQFILENINLEIPYGYHVGIIGRNGSGKSTLIKILTRLYNNYSGEIKINNISIKNISMSDYRKKVAVIPQDIFLFDGTIRENILYGNPSATTEEIVEAAKLAEIHDFIKNQYLGYNIKIGQNGIKLSGGQQLKIAFARLFISNPEIIILDEASSALDISTEKIILKNIKDKFKGKTIISIAHRIHTLKSSDMIVIMDQKTIVEKGKHNQLMENEGIYKEFIETYLNF